MKRGWALAAGLLVASCGSSATAPPAPPPPPAVPVGPPPIAVLPPPPISIPPAPVVPTDQCGAWELQHLVGRSRTEIPVPVEPRRRRVLCTTCPRTMDYSAERMTIEYDTQTNRITSITCG